MKAAAPTDFSNKHTAPYTWICPFFYFVNYLIDIDYDILCYLCFCELWYVCIGSCRQKICLLMFCCLFYVIQIFFIFSLLHRYCIFFPREAWRIVLNDFFGIIMKFWTLKSFLTVHKSITFLIYENYLSTKVLVTIFCLQSVFTNIMLIKVF
jgi:hypothetical protein